MTFFQNRIIAMTAASAALFAFGCSTPAARTGAPSKAYSPTELDALERNDTTGAVSAAREAAENLLENAKAEAARIVANAKKLSAPEKAAIRAKFAELAEKESKEQVEKLIKDAEKAAAAKVAAAKKKAADIIAAAKKKAADTVAKANAQSAKIISDSLEATKKSREMTEKAKAKAAQIIAEAKNASKKADAIIAKAKAEADKIVSDAKKTAEILKKTVADQAAQIASDIIKQTLEKAAKIKKNADKALESAKIYSAKKKSDADIYLRNKMAEADKSAEEFAKQMKNREVGTGQAANGAKPALADNIVAGILDAMKSGDYADFTENFTKDLKKKITEKNFKIMNEKLREKIGDCLSRQFLGTVRKGPLIVYLWKARYAKAENNDLILRLALGELDGKLRVFAFDVSNL